jgi:hypothetical protein
MQFVSGPAIAKLLLRTRKWAHTAIRRGLFGTSIEHHGILFVPLPAVESYFGLVFSPEQITHATDGLPDRVLHFRLQEPSYGSSLQA